MSINVFIKIILLSFTLLLLKCGEEEGVGKGFIVESDHFTIIAVSNDNSLTEMEEVRDHAETMYGRIVNIIGAENAPDQKITVLLKGDHKDQDPKFDPEGVHLYRYSKVENGYNSLFTHELGHAIKVDYYIEIDPYKWSEYPYYDEAFAEYLAQLVEPDKTGYPFYGFSEDVVVGSFLLNDRAIPQKELRTRHFELNNRCNTQAYPLRASWIRYFDEQFEREATLELIFTDQVPNAELIESLTTTPIDSIDVKWEKWVLERYHNTHNADAIADEYASWISWYTYCEE